MTLIPNIFTRERIKISPTLGWAMTGDTTPRMKDVSHTPPEGESVTNVWQRGRKKPTDEAPAPADD
jgi:hypothetical protein